MIHMQYRHCFVPLNCTVSNFMFFSKHSHDSGFLHFLIRKLNCAQFHRGLKQIVIFSLCAIFFCQFSYIKTKWLPFFPQGPRQACISEEGRFLSAVLHLFLCLPPPQTSPFLPPLVLPATVVNAHTFATPLSELLVQNYPRYQLLLHVSQGSFDGKGLFWLWLKC